MQTFSYEGVNLLWVRKHPLIQYFQPGKKKTALILESTETNGDLLEIFNTTLLLVHLA